MSDIIDQIPETPAGASPVAPGTLDRSGVPFDAARHIARQHPTTGRWMPRGGRKPKNAAPSSSITSTPPVLTAPAPPAPSSPSSPSPDGSPGAAPDPTAALGAEMAATMPEVTVSPTPAETAARAAQPGATTPAGSFIPTPEPERSAPAQDAKAELMDDAKSSAEDNAEVACQTLYSLTGLVTGQSKEARPDASEHAALRRTLAAYFRARGIVAVGTIAVCVSVFAYFIRTGQKEATANVARGWWQRLWAKKPAPVSRAADDAAGPATHAEHSAPTHSGIIVVD